LKATQSVIVRLLQNLGSSREVEQYLKQFAALDSQKFAIIKVGGGILEDQLDDLAGALTFLTQVGLFPIVVHGAGPQLNRALAQEGIETRRIDGMRVTDEETLRVARRVFREVGESLVDKLESLGTRARPIHSGVLEAEPLDFERYGYVGKVTQVHLDPLRSAVRKSGCLPIVSSLAETPGGQIMNINADVAARELALAIGPFKIIFLTPTGGLLDEHGGIMSAVNLAEDFQHLMGQDWVAGGMRLKLEEINGLLQNLPYSSSVSITKPSHLAKELFTYRGSGTLIRRGERVVEHHDLENVDQPRMKELLETCFQKRLAPGYFESKEFFRLYLADSYRATAILTKELGVPYLDKFAVTQQAQGEGIGGSIWQRMRQDNPQLFWRARVGNDINGWYFRHADGTYRSGDWVVFWYGLDDFATAKDCVDRALALPATMLA
jgi:bifunctional N-acetylglutamate synthase/kinase